VLAQQITNGIITGSVYALFALGFTLIFSVHRLLNLAHGAIFMFGAITGYYLVISGLSIWIASILAALISGLLSILVQIVTMQRLRRHPLPCRLRGTSRRRSCAAALGLWG